MMPTDTMLILSISELSDSWRLLPENDSFCTGVQVQCLALAEMTYWRCGRS
jgi:hypothetical protein